MAAKDGFLHTRKMQRCKYFDLLDDNITIHAPAARTFEIGLSEQFQIGDIWGRLLEQITDEVITRRQRERLRNARQFD